MLKRENYADTAIEGLTDYFIMEWIKISDKLPPCNERVIVLFKSDTIKVRYLPRKESDLHFGWYPGGQDLDCATHWMPLPPVPDR